MDRSMVEENGGNSSQDPLALNNTSNNSSSSSAATAVAGNGTVASSKGTSAGGSGSSTTTTAANIVQFIPTQTTSAQPQSSVIQAANQSQSVIQTAPNIQSLTLNKGNFVVVNKSNSVIHTAPSGIHVKIKPEPMGMNSGHLDSNSEDDSLTDDESPKRRRDVLTRRPSYHKILKEISGPDIAVIPTTTLQISNVQGGVDGSGLHGLSSGGSGGTIVQYSQPGSDGQFFVPVLGSPVIAEDQSRKREIRLQKNREAARECRRKKKEYIKCLENRVAVLENQNKALIEELKTLKELYCQTKIE